MSTIPRPIFKHLIGIGAVLAAALLLGFPAPALDEIDYAETNTNLVRVNSWNPEATGSDPSRWRWRVTHGFGDCSAGCIFRDVIEVDVTDKGEVALVSASCASGLPDHLREQQQLAPLCKAYKRR